MDCRRRIRGGYEQESRELPLRPYLGLCLRVSNSIGYDKRIDMLTLTTANN